MQFPKSKAGVASILVGVGLVMLGLGHLLQGQASQAFADFAGAAGTLGLPALFGTPASPVTIQTPGPVTVRASSDSPIISHIEVPRTDGHT